MLLRSASNSCMLNNRLIILNIFLCYVGIANVQLSSEHLCEFNGSRIFYLFISLLLCLTFF